MKLFFIFIFFLLNNSDASPRHRSNGMTKLLVAGGASDETTFLTSVEVVNLDDSNPDVTCQNLPDLPATIFGAAGYLLNNTTPIICGGYVEAEGTTQSKCYALVSGQWTEVESLPEKRAFPGSAIMNDKFLVLGGEQYEEPDLNYLSSIAAFDGAAWSQGSIADLPEPMAGACVVNFGGSFLFATGGFDYKTEPNCKDKTYFYDESEKKWEKGPRLNTPRSGHSCGIISSVDPTTGEELRYVVVAGGQDRAGDGFLSSVEVLDMQNIISGWMYDTELPNAAFVSTMLNYEDSLIMVGGIRGLEGDRLYRHSSPHGEWVEMKQTLKEKRGAHVSFFVPDHLVTCQ